MGREIYGNVKMVEPRLIAGKHVSKCHATLLPAGIVGKE